MMISAVRTDGGRRDGGFTLLEMVVVLSIFTLFMGGALAAIHFTRDEQQLRSAAGEVEIMAKRARTVAAFKQTPYALEFFNGEVSMLPLAEAMIPPGDRGSYYEDREAQARSFMGGDDEEYEDPVVRNSWVADRNMLMLVQRWGSNDWIEITDRNRQVWRFDPNGICEPVGVRFELDGSWIETVFHPLTAGVADRAEEMK